MRDDALTYASVPGGREGTVVLRLTGPLTLGNMFQFQADLRSLQPATLILDLSETPYIDSAGLGVLMNAYVSAQNHNRRYGLAAVNGRVLALLELTRVHQVLRIFPTVEEAEAGL